MICYSVQKCLLDLPQVVTQQSQSEPKEFEFLEKEIDEGMDANSPYH